MPRKDLIVNIRIMLSLLRRDQFPTKNISTPELRAIFSDLRNECREAGLMKA